jgi:hypothetical protein
MRLPVPARMALVIGLLAAAASAAVAQGAKSSTQQAVSYLLLPAMLVGWGAFQAVVAMLLPRWTAATRDAVETRRGWCLGWGAAMGLLALVAALIGGALRRTEGGALEGVAAGLAAVILLLVVLASALGFAGVAAAAGRRLVPIAATDDERAPSQAFAGGLTVSLACLVPVLGQILGLLVFLASLGAAARALATGLRTE